MNNNVNDKNFVSTPAFQEFMDENPSRGSLKVRAYAASQAIPIKNLKVTVSKEIGGDEIIFFDGFTDESGMTEKIILPAPKLVEDNLDKPNKTTYEVTTTYEPDALIGKYSVNIYENICVIQNVSIVPDMHMRWY